MYTRRQNLAYVLVLVIVVVLTAACTGPSGKVLAAAKTETYLVAPLGKGQPAPRTNPTDTRPNIVMISADDMRADELRFMPQTKALLGDQGLVFTDALTPHPLCCPARAELLTGQYAQNNGVRTNWGPQGGYEALDPSRTIGTMLSDSGYNTAFLGKHLNSVKFPNGPNPGWTIFNPTLSGYNNYYDFYQYDNGLQVRVPEQYYTDYLTEKTTAYLQQLSSLQSPFFMWVSNFGPHSGGLKDGKVPSNVSPPDTSPSYKANTALVAQDRQAGKKYFQRIAAKPSYNELDRSDKVEWVRTKKRQKANQIRAMLRGRIGALHSIDEQVSQAVKTLDELGELSNTYIVFITDNGYLVGEHGIANKILGYEEALKTPLLVRGPGIAPGGKLDQTVTLVDLAPTFLDLASATSSLLMDGASLKPLILGTSTDEIHPKGVLIQAGPTRGATGPRGWFFRGLRTDRYVFIQYANGFRELYDRRRDPYQVKSLAYDARYANVVKKMKASTSKRSACAGYLACR